jgi:hypothetical protein
MTRDYKVVLHWTSSEAVRLAIFARFAYGLEGQVDWEVGHPTGRLAPGWIQDRMRLVPEPSGLTVPIRPPRTDRTTEPYDDLSFFI